MTLPRPPGKSWGDAEPRGTGARGGPRPRRGPPPCRGGELLGSALKWGLSPQMLADFRLRAEGGGLIPSLCAETLGVQGLWTRGWWTTFLPGVAFGVKDSCHCRMSAGGTKERTSPSLTIAGFSPAPLALPAPRQLISQRWHRTPATAAATGEPDGALSS